MRRFLPLAAPLLLLLVLLAPAASASGGHYVPRANDGFGYAETIFLNNGVGNYTGYSESSFYNGSMTMTSVLPNGSVSASYQASGTYRNSTGASAPWSESGTFAYSSVTYLYTQGTDNQSGFVNPHVWFYMDNSLATGAQFYILNTPLTISSTDFAYPLSWSPTGYVQTISASGSGSYQRHDVYGMFSATYTWQANFDPSTGYIVGYVYSETDRDAAGNGFSWTDTLTDTHSTFSLTSAAAPPSSGGSTSLNTSTLLVVGLGIFLLIVVLIAVLLWARSRRRRASLPQHSGPTIPPAPPGYAPPPPLNLIPADQPPVQQVVLRETVKVPCQFCGTLIDSTATNCPKCGAPRT